VAKIKVGSHVKVLGDDVPNDARYGTVTAVSGKWATVKLWDRKMPRRIPVQELARIWA